MLSDGNAFIANLGDALFNTMPSIINMLVPELTGTVIPGSIYINETLYTGFFLDANLEWYSGEFMHRLDLDNRLSSRFITLQGNRLTTGQHFSPILREVSITWGIRSSSIFTKVD
jgi:hypothetical protein